MEYNITTIIPARAGSVRLPGKNTRILAGQPMIQYSIDAAKNSSLINGDYVVITTDDKEVMKTRDVNYIRKRPPELATSEAAQVDVVLDAVAWFNEQGHTTDVVILLQPTSPLRTGLDIDMALQQYIKTGTKSLVSVSFVQESPWDMIDASGNICTHRKENYLFLSGALYIIDIDLLRTSRQFYHPGVSSLYFMPKWRSIDVDDEEDFIIAEKIIRGGAYNG